MTESNSVAEITSAGVLLYHDGADGVRRWLTLHSRKGHWDFAKGRVEPGETLTQAARRELAEEAGIDPDAVTMIDGFHQTVRYQVVKKGRLADKAVHYFLARSPADAVAISREHTDWAWWTAEQCRDRLTHDNARRLIQDAVAHLADTR